MDLKFSKVVENIKNEESEGRQRAQEAIHAFINGMDDGSYAEILSHKSTMAWLRIGSKNYQVLAHGDGSYSFSKVGAGTNAAVEHICSNVNLNQLYRAIYAASNEEHA